MLRSKTETGWWLTTHVDHARLAAAFAEHWGNEDFLPPEPRAQVLTAIAVHDDGWAARDEHPQITKQGRPSAFSSELVGKYSAFEEIDLEDYLAVRDRAVRLIAKVDHYAAILVSMHTYDLLTKRSDRSTIAPDQLPLLDAFLAEQKALQAELYAAVLAAPHFKPDEVKGTRIEDHFRLLQACDNLSLLSCVDYSSPASLLHALPLRHRHSQLVTVQPLGQRHFRLDPYPLNISPLSFQFQSRHIEGEKFESSTQLDRLFAAATPTAMCVTLTA
jgi:hypothetical protein